MIFAAQGGRTEFHRLAKSYQQICSWQWWEVWHRWPRTPCDRSCLGRPAGPDHLPSAPGRRWTTQQGASLSFLNTDRSWSRCSWLPCPELTPSAWELSYFEPDTYWTPRKTWCWNNVKCFVKKTTAAATTTKLREKIWGLETESWSPVWFLGSRDMISHNLIHPVICEPPWNLITDRDGTVSYRHSNRLYGSSTEYTE